MRTFAAKQRFTKGEKHKKFHARIGRAEKRNILKAIFGGLIGTMLFGNVAMAQTCASYPYTFSNGTTADANQVNSNFSSVLSCANTLLAPLSSPNFTGNGTISGYWRVGSSSAPANTTAGDLTAVRLSIGNSSLSTFSTDGALIGPTETETSGAANAIFSAATLAPASNSSAAFYSIQARNILNAASINFTGTSFNALAGGYFFNEARNVGTIAAANGVQAIGLSASSNGASLGTVTTVNAGYFMPINSFSNSLASTVTSAYGVHIVNSANGGSGPLSIIGQAGLDIETISGATNNTGFLLGTAAIPTGNFGIYDASANNNYFAGKVGIGTSSPAVTLAVVGDIRTGTSGTNGCLQNFAGTALAGTCSSDAALKTVQGNVVGILDKFANLQLVKFYWNKTAASVYHNSTTELNTGFVAQAVEKQFPELVSIDSKGYRQLDYTTLSLYGLEAIKELKAANDRLKTVNDSQAAQIAQLQNEISELQRKTDLRSAANENSKLRVADMGRNALGVASNRAGKIVELNAQLSDQERRLMQLEARLNNLAAANDNRERKGHLRTAQR